MRAAKALSLLLLVLILLVAIGFGAAYFWGKKQSQVDYRGEWRLSADAMADAMADKGYSMIEVRKFYVANRGGLTRMTVDSKRIVRTREGKTNAVTYTATPDSPGCWAMILAGGVKERWCMVKAKLQVTGPDGNTFIYRQEGAGNMKSDTAPLQ
jgi:hypothetical protein